MSTVTLTPTPYQTFLDGSGNPLNGGKVQTYLAGTTTPVVTYSDAVMTPNANPVVLDSAGRATIFLTPGVSYKFVVLDSTGATVRTQDNILAVPTASGVVEVLGTAGETITANAAVYLSDGSGGKTVGQWYNADNANAYSSLGPVVGIATVAIASSGTGTIRTMGELTNLSGLTVGADYYIGTAGAITTSMPASNARVIGRAESTTSLFINPQQRGTTGYLLTGVSSGPATYQNASSVGASLVLLKTGSGTSTAAGATNVDTVAVSGLTTDDKIKVLVQVESVTQQTAGCVLYNVTDSVSVLDVAGGAAISAGTTESSEAVLMPKQGSTTSIMGSALGNTSANTVISQGAVSTFTTAWTGSWTLALRHTGVTAGGTFKYRWSVYKVMGQ